MQIKSTLNMNWNAYYLFSSRNLQGRVAFLVLLLSLMMISISATLDHEGNDTTTRLAQHDHSLFPTFFSNSINPYKKGNFNFQQVLHADKDRAFKYAYVEGKYEKLNIELPGVTYDFKRNDITILFESNGGDLNQIIERLSRSATCCSMYGNGIIGSSSQNIENPDMRAVLGVSSIPTQKYKEAWYDQLPGEFDLHFRLNSSGKLVYDYVFAPGADPSKALIEITDAPWVLSSEGKIMLNGKVLRQAPIAYQIDENGKQIEVIVKFVKVGFSYGFQIQGPLKKNFPLIISTVTFSGNS